MLLFAPAALHWAWTGAIVAAVALGVAVFTLWPRVVVAPGVTRRFTIQPSGDARIWRPQPRFAMSADGRAIAYIANSGQKNSVYVRLLDQTAPRQLPGTEGAVELAFSPDGQWLAFEANNTLKQVSLTSGAPPVTLASVTNILDQSLTWLSDDTIVVGQLEKGLSTIPAGGGAMATLTTPDALHGELDHHFPRPLPGGKALLFTRHRKANAEVFDVAVLHVDTGAVRVVLADAFDARYIAPGHLVFARSGSLFVVPFDLDRLELTGTPVVMVERVMTASNVAGSGTFGWGARYAIADDGTLAYIPAPARAGRRLVWVSGGGAIEPLPLEPRAFSRPSLSPDGKRVAVQVEDDGLDVWVSEISQRTSTRLTWDGVSQAPIWTPDGQRVTFSTIKDGREELHWQRLDGGASERLRSDDVRLYPGSWSPHGRTLAFLRNPPSDVTSFGLFDVGTRSATPLLPDQSDVVHPQISPDGLWVAYTSQSPRQQIHVSSVDGRGVKRQISTDGGFAPAWSPDGRRLYYLGPAGVRDVFMVDVSRLPSAVGKPQLFAKDFPMVRGGVLHPGFDVAPDGRLLMVQSDPEEAAPLRFEIVINWFEELKRRVPLGQ